MFESFVKASLVNDINPKIDTFFYIQIKDENSKIFYVENNAIKFEQKFNFGTEIIVNDICKITSLGNKVVKDIILENKDIFGRNTELKKIGIDDGFPEYILNNKDKLAEWII